jgi:antitoxin (DNA-binding transcriptional repressor) of toxin-antitoxin stability system
MRPELNIKVALMETAALHISIGELKARPAYAIAKAQAGIKVQITSHRKTVAQLVAADADVPAKPSAKPARKTAASKKPMTAQEAVRLLRSGGAGDRGCRHITAGGAHQIPTDARWQNHERFGQ